ncbi:NADH-dependent flavin oxidoreductase-like protein [Hyaloscypha variabilis]
MISLDTTVINRGADNVPYFTPAQDLPSGTAVNPQPNGKKIPKLFQPLSIRGQTFQNRVWNGRIDPNRAGLWKDEQIASLKTIVDFTHSQTQLIGIQLFHGGRKASTVAPWLGAHNATREAGGWGDDIIGSSAVPYDENSFVPREMTLSDIAEFRKDWVSAVKRSLRAGFDVIEIHAAHGFLLHIFSSPVSNKRTDMYGGSFENRIRLLLEIIQDTRHAILGTMPLFLRVTATYWLAETEIESWTIEDTIDLSLRAAALGVDFIDVSSGGSHPTGFSKQIKSVVKDKVLVGAVGSITNGVQANDLLEEGLDAVFSGRLFQKNPGLVWSWADDLGIVVHAANQIKWGFKNIPGLGGAASSATLGV